MVKLKILFGLFVSLFCLCIAIANAGMSSICSATKAISKDVTCCYYMLTCF